MPEKASGTIKEVEWEKWVVGCWLKVMASVEPALALKKELVSGKSCLEEYCRYCSTRLVLDAKDWRWRDGMSSLFSLYFGCLRSAALLPCSLLSCSGPLQTMTAIQTNGTNFNQRNGGCLG